MSKHQENAEHERPPVANIQGMSTAMPSAQGLALLGGLVGFIRQHVDAHARATGYLQGRQDFDLRAERACSGVQGQALLSALGRFFEYLITPGDDNVNARGALELVTSKDRETIPVQQHVSIAKPMVMGKLSQTIIDQVHQHVFNEMPIRMLAFNSNGTQLRLVKRSEIAEQIKFRISQENWTQRAKSMSLIRVKELGRYAILSHTWFRGEPGDVVYGNWEERELNPEGNSKIVNFCEVAAHDYGVIYGWMDTVCIDKSSSTELDESIRSMYRWYRQSHICITYLADTSKIPDMHRDTWFTRGWTLQELLAPHNLVFYSKNWTSFPRNDKLIIMEQMVQFLEPDCEAFPQDTQSQISQATSIDKDELLICLKDPALLPISRVFQLASLRNVTREEDRVYSLMGLLGVSISVAYGEGLPAAFKRLVHEIMVTKTNFLDIFNHSNQAQLTPMNITQYATRSSLFDRTSSHRSTELHWHTPIEPISMTHLGVHVPILLVPLFRGPITGAPISSGKHPHPISIPWLEHNEYHVLEQNAISIKFIANYKQKKTLFPLAVIFCGILNFWKSRSGYGTSNRWLYLTFRLEYNSLPNLSLTDINTRDLLQWLGPEVQSWPRKHSPGYEEMQEQNLRKMGMQVTTLYLK